MARPPGSSALALLLERHRALPAGANPGALPSRELSSCPFGGRRQKLTWLDIGRQLRPDWALMPGDFSRGPLR